MNLSQRNLPKTPKDQNPQPRVPKSDGLSLTQKTKLLMQPVDLFFLPSPGRATTGWAGGSISPRDAWGAVDSCRSRGRPVCSRARASAVLPFGSGNTSVTCHYRQSVFFISYPEEKRSPPRPVVIMDPLPLWWSVAVIHCNVVGRNKQ